MAFINSRLSPRVEAGFSVVPASSTLIKMLRSGRERRNGQWAQKRRRYTAKLASFTLEERQELLGVIHATEGALHSFRLKDWLDYRARNVSLGVAPSGSTPVQLTVPYTFGSQTHTRTITKPVASTLVLRQAGTPKAGTLDDTTGLFTPTTAWSAGQALTADFDFDVPVRFLTDEPQFALPHRDIADLDIELIEVFGE
jgi:uncharacterized protein (TIGR02217 family)